MIDQAEYELAQEMEASRASGKGFGKNTFDGFVQVLLADKSVGSHSVGYKLDDNTRSHVTAVNTAGQSAHCLPTKLAAEAACGHSHPRLHRCLRDANIRYRYL